MGRRTPWGTADHSIEYRPGITFYTTSSHGGFFVSKRLNVTIPDYMRQGDGWYEEDCDWAIVAICFPDDMQKRDEKEGADVQKTKDQAEHTFKNWHPDAWERWHGKTLERGESYKRDEATFHMEHKERWVTIAAWGDWKDGVPKGMVGVLATLGGERHTMGELRHERAFLVSTPEYSPRDFGMLGHPFGFVINEQKHAEIETEVLL